MKLLMKIVPILAYGLIGLIAAACMHAVGLDATGALILGIPLACLIICSHSASAIKEIKAEAIIWSCEHSGKGMDYSNLSWWEVFIIILSIVLVISVIGQCLPIR